MTSPYTVFDHLSDGVQIIDAQWRYVYVNDVVVEHGHTTREALIGQTMMEAYPGIEKTKMFAALEACRATGAPVRTTNDFIFPDGTKQYFHLRIDPFERSKLIIFSTDTTEDVAHRVLLEDEGAELEQVVQKRTALLTQQNRELQQFTAVVSHDLRAPLRTIRSFVELIHQDYALQLDARGREYLGWVLEGTARLQKVLEALLIHARIGNAREPKLVDLTEVLLSVRRDLVVQLEEAEATLKVGSLPDVLGFESELRLLFQNLMTNALKYRRPGQPVRIEVDARPANDGAGHHFTVKDDGQGIDARYHGRIFNLFERLHDEQAAGIGIGLAHCEKIVGLHSGRIWVESTPGEGSTFHFTIREPIRPATVVATAKSA